MAITFDVVKKPAVDFAVDNVRVAAGGGEAYEGNYEITPAAAVLAGGSDAVILRHPEAIKTIAAMIRALI